MRKTVLVDCLQESSFRYRTGHVIVVVDVIRATTTATTALATGRRVLPVRTSDEAFVVASTLERPLLVGELGGNMPYGFDLTNSPARIAEHNDVSRPMVLVSSSGTTLIMNSAGAPGVYLACFRNFSAVAKHLIDTGCERVAILGAGTRGQFRREDQMCCAWVAEKLVEAGYEAETAQTREYIYRWKGTSPNEVRGSESAAYLVDSGQTDDLEFVLSHIDDLELVPKLVNYELVAAKP
jgi:2-phosphosulfolactate phosphatase